MYCAKCGAVLDANNVCPNNCVVPQARIDYVDNMLNEYEAYVSKTKIKRRISVKCIVGLALSVVGIFFGGIPCGIAGLILCAKGLQDIDYGFYKGKAMGIIGIVMSIIDILGATISVFYFLFLYLPA